MQDPSYRNDLAIRFRRFAILAYVFLAVVAANYFTVQVVEGSHYRELAESNRLRRLTIAAPRGLIFDRNGVPLVENVPQYNLMLDRSLARDLPATLRHVTTLLPVTEEELLARLAEEKSAPLYQPVPLVENLTFDQVARIGVERLDHPEIEVSVEHVRLYRHGEQTAHLMGYLGEVSEQEIAQFDGLYRPGQMIGKKGVERLYEAHLRGEDGDRMVVVDNRGQQRDELGIIPAVAGRDLTLTLDLPLQQEAAELLKDHLAGSVIAMDPRTGEIRALASSPAFDPNRFSTGISAADWKALLDNPKDPMQNRAIQNAYPPGSTFKIVMALGGLQEGVIDRYTTAFCPGFSNIAGHVYRCWKDGGHGSVNVHAAIKGSCNVYFHQVGQKLGIERIGKYARLMGFARPTGIDLAGEKPGLIGSDDWSRRVRGHQWWPGETISVSTGQGPVNATPIQLAVMSAMVANGGHVVRPRLVPEASGVVAAGEMERRARLAEHEDPKDVIRDVFFEWVSAGMRAVVNEPGGTAGRSKLALEGIEMAGKTGTAQVIHQAVRVKSHELPPDQRDHAWFVSFAPADDPQLAIAVFVEHGGGGSAAAAPIAKALYEKYFESHQPDRTAS